MSELKLISPLLDGLELVHTIQTSGSASVCLLRRAQDGKEYVLKLISVPESQTQVDALILTGAAADEEAAKAYYEQVVEDYQNELSSLDALKDSTNVATYLGRQVCPKEEGIGFEIYLLSEKWTTLVSYISENAMTHLRALNLGLDLCSALCDLRAHGLIHRNIKPENIYLNGLNGFMLGDLGTARIDQLKYCTMPDHMISEYTAPELSDILGPFNTTVDIYSVGMVLYRILNGNHGPFEDEKTSPKAANKRRVSGEALPAPLYSDYELTEIILRACAFEPADRYQTPEEFMQDLVFYMKRNTVTDSLIVPPIITDPDCRVSPEDQDEEIEPVSFTDVNKLDQDFVKNFSPDTQSLGAVTAAVRAEEARGAPAPAAPPEAESAPAGERPQEAPAAAFAAPPVRLVPEDEESAGGAAPPPAEAVKKAGKKRRRIWIPIVLSVVLLGAIAAGVYYLILGGPPLNITGISVVDKGTDYLTVDVQASETGQNLTLLCSDAYGNVYRENFVGLDVTFSSLTPGTQYTLSLVSGSKRKLTGTTSVKAATTAATEIVSFTASSSSVGQADLSLTVSGPNPGEWTVRYSADGVAEKSATFTGGTTTITGLEPGKEYTFELVAPEGVALSGESSVKFTSTQSVTVSDLKAAELTKSTVKVTWTSDNDPGEWSVTCAGTDGSTKTQTTTDREAEFTELAAGETYTITVTSASTQKPATITVVPTAATISAVKASAENAGTVNVSWTSESGADGWQIVYTPKGSSLSLRQSATKNQATLTGLIPGTTYEIELQSATGEKLSGKATAEVKTPAAAKFGSYGATRFFLGTFYLPSQSKWTYRDLGDGSKEFKASDRIAFAIQTLTGLEKSDDAVAITCVVRDAKGVPVECFSTQSTWNAMWDDELYCGALQTTPQTAGVYTLSVYFNNQLATGKEFTVA